MDYDSDGSFQWDEPTDALGKVDELQAIYLLHKNIWTPALFNNPNLNFCYNKILAPRERQVVDLKVDGVTDGEIAVLLKVSIPTIKRYVYNIRYIYRNRCRDRVYTKWARIKHYLNRYKKKLDID